MQKILEQELMQLKLQLRKLCKPSDGEDKLKEVIHTLSYTKLRASRKGDYLTMTIYNVRFKWYLFDDYGEWEFEAPTTTIL